MGFKIIQSEMCALSFGGLKVHDMFSIARKITTETRCCTVNITPMHIKMQMHVIQTGNKCDVRRTK